MNTGTYVDQEHDKVLAKYQPGSPKINIKAAIGVGGSTKLGESKDGDGGQDTKKFKKLAHKIQLAARVVQNDEATANVPEMKNMAKKLELAAHKVTGKHIGKVETMLKKAEIKRKEEKKEVHKEVKATLSQLSATQSKAEIKR